MEGQQVRARVHWKTRGHRGTKEFYNATWPRATQAHITELLSSDSVSYHEQEKLEEICLIFFLQLHQAWPSSPDMRRIQGVVLSRLQSKLTNDMIESLRAPLKLEELSKVVGDMAKLKALGPDGIIIEFYQTMWPIIGRDYLGMVQEAIHARRFPLGVTDGVISLLYKGGPRIMLNLWRPITLLNTSYKVFAKIL